MPKVSTYLLPAPCQHGPSAVWERTDDKLSVSQEARGDVVKCGDGERRISLGAGTLVVLGLVD